MHCLEDLPRGPWHVDNWHSCVRPRVLGVHTWRNVLCVKQRRCVQAGNAVFFNTVDHTGRYFVVGSRVHGAHVLQG